MKLTPAAEHRLDVALKEKVDDTGVPGASAAVVFADGREWSGAVGAAVLHPRQAMTTATAIPFDSVTKIVTASTAMRLVEEGRLRLDDPIRRWYPAWRGDPEATVRDLLGHTSGLKVGPPDALFFRVFRHPRATVTRQQFIVATGKPGPRTEDAEYSDAGFVLAGLILERAGGAPIAALARRDVLKAPGGNGLGTHTELWYLPKERVTVAVAWNDDAIDDDGGIFQALVRAALGSG